MNPKLLMGPDLERTEQHKLASTRARERILTSILKLLATAIANLYQWRREIR